MITATETLGLATKIVDNILADPARAAEFKQNLAATLADLYNSAESKKVEDALDSSKHFLMSKTFWGVVISACAMVAGKFGHQIGNEEIVNYTSTAVGVVGSILALYGRYVAKEDLTWKTS